MFWVNCKRIMKSGFYSFWRNGFVSFSSIFILMITLSVVITTIFVGSILKAALVEVKNKVDINVYFFLPVDPADIATVKTELEALPEVQQVGYTSSQDALAIFKKKHASDQFTLQAIDELNGNPLPASLNIKAKDPAQYEGIAQFLTSKNIVGKDGNPIIEKVNYYQNKNAIDTLTHLTTSTEKFGFMLTIFLILISIIITYTTIRLAIFMSKDEISVMRLVGASRAYIRGPFVVAGMMYGFVSAALTLIFFFPITYYFSSLTQEFFVGVNIFSYYMEHFGQIFGIIMGAGILIGSVSSYFAVRKYLKV